jgi:hypothetical protein
LTPKLLWGTLERFRGFQGVHKYDIDVNLASTLEKSYILLVRGQSATGSIRLTN